MVFVSSTSPKNIEDNTIAIATLILSTGATCDTLPNCKALKQKIHERPVATPDKHRNKIFCFVSSCMVEAPPLTKAIAHAITNITTVLIAVARSVSTPLIPTFAKIAVRAAKNAASNA